MCGFFFLVFIFLSFFLGGLYLLQAMLQECNITVLNIYARVQSQAEPTAGKRLANGYQLRVAG